MEYYGAAKRTGMIQVLVRNKHPFSGLFLEASSTRVLIAHVDEYPTMHYFGIPRHSVNDRIQDFD